MISTKKNILRTLAAATLLTATFTAEAAEVAYKIEEYNKTTGEFTLAACGMIPKGSSVYFQNDYGATTGNRYNQIPNKRKAVLYLDGWQGCTIKNITLGMCSNKSTGQAGLSLTDGEARLYYMPPADFADEAWFGQWVSKDLGVYVDITKSLEVPAIATGEAAITIQGGNGEGSVYLDAITIEYDEGDAGLESPLGWVYEKLVKKSTLSEGDEVMIYRNGCAAGDYDGMAESHYLDAVAVASTSDVTSRDVLCFTLRQVDGAGMWTLTDQYGRTLGATAKQALAWDEGSMQWSIELGYDGATIANANSSYGTLRFSTPEGSYARFNTYTSTSLPLPFLYRRSTQKQPETARTLSLAETEVIADVQDKQVALHATIYPTTTTDKRIVWTSSNPGVATVNGGLVSLLAEGVTKVTASTKDGGAEASVTITVTDESGGIESVVVDKASPKTIKVLENGRVVIVAPDGTRYGVDGTKL